MRVAEVRCRGILSRSGIGGMDYCVNPYLGCSHACVYCYARFMTRFGHAGEGWGTFVDVKVNAVERLRGEAAKKPRGRVILSSVTDPYQPLEGKYKLTRGCLKALLDENYRVDVLTKNALVLRDLDLFKEFDQIEVGLTVTSLDDEVRRVFEPGASTVQERLDVLRKLSNEGIPTYAFLGPMLPYLSEEHLEDLLNVLANRVNRLIVDRLNIKCGNMPAIHGVLNKFYPDLAPMFESALSLSSDYYTQLKKRVTDLCNDRAIPLDIVY